MRIILLVAVMHTRTYSTDTTIIETKEAMMQIKKLMTSIKHHRGIQTPPNKPNSFRLIIGSSENKDLVTNCADELPVRPITAKTE